VLVLLDWHTLLQLPDATRRHADMWCLTSIQKAASVLEEASQASDSQRGACANIAAALVQKPLSDHQDKVTYAAGLRAAADGHAMHHFMNSVRICRMSRRTQPSAWRMSCGCTRPNALTARRSSG
jgi:acyl-CoA reductase-like NAD-dependent aldehyde dehydrogenase